MSRTTLKTVRRRRSQAALVTFLLIALGATFDAGFAQDDGPRMYWVAPTGTNVVQTFAWFSQSNTVSGSGTLFDPSVVTDALAVVASYNRYFDLAHRSLLVTAMLTGGNATTEIAQDVTQSTRGIGDLVIQGNFNLLGGPALDEASFATYEQTTVLSLLLAVSAPTGNYDAQRLLNMGENRWALRVGLPFVQGFGTWRPGKFTTLEVLPSVWFFTSNDEFAGNLKLEQDPLFMAEAHLTRDVTSTFFVAADYLLQAGGETSIDATKQGDSQAASFLGATFGYTLNEQLDLAFRYIASLKPQAERDVDMDVLQLNLTYLW